MSRPAGRPKTSRRVEVAGGSARDRYLLARQAARRRRIARAALAAGAALGFALALRPGGDRWFAVAAVGTGLAALAVRPERDPERWLRGAAGEERSAALLARLGSRRWKVFHDRTVPGHTCNLDHLVIGPTGVWLVDTKTTRAPLRAGWGRVEAGGRPIDTGPAAWEAELVAERLGVAVVALIAVHGHGLARRGRRCGGVRVIPASGLVHRLRRGDRWVRRRVLTRAQIADLAERASELFPPPDLPRQSRRVPAAGSPARARRMPSGGR